jgi:SAM-dependent methyltransferase
MGVNLEKIDKFYKSDLGLHVHAEIERLLTKNLNGQGSDCVLSPGARFYEDVIRQSFNFLSYHTDSNQKENEYSLTWQCSSHSVDSVVMIHDLEFSRNPENHIKESFRVLKGDGRLILVFPNRSGGWARRDNTPFGVGAPRTLGQVKRLLSEYRFNFESAEGALFFPPYNPKVDAVRRIVNTMHGFAVLNAGIFMVIAHKRERAGIKEPVQKIREAVEGALVPKPTTAAHRTPITVRVKNTP